MPKEHVYRVRFVSQDKIYELYAKDAFQGELYGFVVLEDLLFDEHTTVVVDPSEEKLKSEFEGVARTIIPCLLYTSPSPRDQRGSRMPSSA